MKTVMLKAVVFASLLVTPAISAAGTIISATGGMTFHPISHCTVVRTASAVGPFAADETRSYLVRGETTDLSGQGGESGGCGIPEGADAISINVIATAGSSGAVKVWSFDQTEPAKFMNLSVKDDFYNGSAIVELGDPSSSFDFNVKVFRTVADVMIVVNGYLVNSSPAVSLDGVDIAELGLRHAGGESSNHRLVSAQGYYVDVINGGALRSTIIYYISSDCTCSNVNCSGEAFVDGMFIGQPGQVIRGTDGSDPFGNNRIFYIEKTATYNVGLTGTTLDPNVGTGSRRVTSTCQSNQDLEEGFPVLINDPSVTGIDTDSSGVLDATQRHFVTFE